VHPLPGGECGFLCDTYAFFATPPGLGGTAERLFCSPWRTKGEEGPKGSRLLSLVCFLGFAGPCSGKVGRRAVPPFRPRSGVCLSPCLPTPPVCKRAEGKAAEGTGASRGSGCGGCLRQRKWSPMLGKDRNYAIRCQLGDVSVNTKTPIIGFFADNLSAFLFDKQSRPNLVFRHRLPNGLFQCIAVQRDSKSNGLAPNLAVTYSSLWRGEPAVPLGIDRGFPQLRQKRQMVPAMDYWYFYEPTPAGLLSTLQVILADYHSLAIPFFAEAETELLGNKLLQTALREASTIPSEARIGLAEALAKAGYVVAKCEHPAFLALRDRIRAAWTNDVSKEQRRWTSRLAYDTLVFV
jgi:hypothetical protein